MSEFLPRPQREARVRVGIGAPLASASVLSARLKTATPPIHPVKPTLRELWITRPMVKGPSLAEGRIVFSWS